MWGEVSNLRGEWELRRVADDLRWETVAMIHEAMALHLATAPTAPSS